MFIVRKALDGHKISDQHAPGNISCIALDYLGYNAVYGSETGAITRWNTEQSSGEQNCDCHVGFVSHLSLCRDGRRTVSIACDHVLRIWDAIDDKLVGCIENVYWIVDVAFSADNDFIIHSSPDPDGIRFWSATSLELVCTAQPRKLARMAYLNMWLCLFYATADLKQFGYGQNRGPEPSAMCS